jgi:hypothetical protein
MNWWNALSQDNQITLVVTWSVLGTIIVLGAMCVAGTLLSY